MSVTETQLRLIRIELTSAWVALVVLTTMSLVTAQVWGGRTWEPILVLGVSAIKVRIVGTRFMGLRTGPRALCLAFDGYCLVVWAALAALYCSA